MSNLGAYLAVDAWPQYEGSHMQREHWAEYPMLIRGGVKGAVYILWPGSDAQHRDLERLRHDAGQAGLGFDTLVLRLGWPRFERFPEPAEFVQTFRAKIAHAQAQGFPQLWVMLANEPNIELVEHNPDGTVKRTITSARDFLAWYRGVVAVWQADPDLRHIPLVPPAVSAYAPNDWEWWDQALREIAAMSTVGNVHLYPTNEAELTGAWSLPWWKGQMPGKRLFITEMGCRTGTPAATRNQLLPQLWRQVRHDPEVGFAAWFAQWTAGREHAEHWWTPAQMAAYLAVAVEQSAPPPVAQPTPPTDNLEHARIVKGLALRQRQTIQLLLDNLRSLDSDAKEIIDRAKMMGAP